MAKSARALYDVVVIGGGPAGAAAAYTAASNGLRTCIIDKSTFPREKLCGGLITLRSKSVFENVFYRTWDDSLFVACDDIKFYSHERRLAEMVGYSTLYFTMRRDFDAYLLGLASEAGATLRLGSAMKSFDLAAGEILLENDEEVKFKYLIGADGVNSAVAKTLFGRSFDPKTIGFGLEVEVPRADMRDASDRVEIDFAAADSGYGWVFPKKKTFTVGVGGIHVSNRDMPDKLAKYLALKVAGSADYKVKGQYIPFGDFRVVPGSGNVLLCGDAAGVVDPITGEGIAYAIETGAAAARAVFSGLAEGCPDHVLRYYLQDYKQVASTIRQAKFWRLLIFPRSIQPLFTRAFVNASTMRRGYLDIMAGRHGYEALPRLIAAQAGRAAKRIFSH